MTSVTIGSSPRVELVGSTVAGVPAQPPVGTDSVDLSASMVAAADSFTLLFAMECAQRDAQSASSECEIRQRADKVAEFARKFREALEKAREAAREQSFWDDLGSTMKTVGTIAAVAGAAASVVATGGLSAPAALAIAGSVISVGAEPVVTQLGGSEELAGWVAFGGAALSGGAGLWAAGTAPSGLTTAQRIAEGGKSLANGAGAAAQLVQGYAAVRSGDSQADGKEAHASGRAARAQQTACQREFDQIVESLRELERCFQSAKESLVEAQQERARSLQAAADFGRRA